MPLIPKLVRTAWSPRQNERDDELDCPHYLRKKEYGAEGKEDGGAGEGQGAAAYQVIRKSKGNSGRDFCTGPIENGYSSRAVLRTKTFAATVSHWPYFIWTLNKRTSLKSLAL